MEARRPRVFAVRAEQEPPADVSPIRVSLTSEDSRWREIRGDAPLDVWVTHRSGSPAARLQMIGGGAPAPGIYNVAKGKPPTLSIAAGPGECVVDRGRVVIVEVRTGRSDAGASVVESLTAWFDVECDLPGSGRGTHRFRGCVQYTR
jgi:hypothetical protein